MTDDEFSALLDDIFGFETRGPLDHRRAFRVVTSNPNRRNETTTTTDQQLKTSMRRHWLDGKRQPVFHEAVRSDRPDATLVQFNDAADDFSDEIPW